MNEAKRLKVDTPDLFAFVKDGSKTLSQAKREYNQRTMVEPQAIAGRYRVWYADPPWQYSDSGLDNYGHAEGHYTTMSTDAICDMGDEIKAACDEKAVLFLWVTAPMLPEGLQVVQAWNFQYKGHFIWDKVKHNFGHYNSVQHELLLIATKGSCTPDVPKLFDSVVEEERSNIHSRKPDIFREIIDTIYPHGNRIELFARQKAEGWESWGADVSQCPQHCDTVEKGAKVA